MEKEDIKEKNIDVKKNDKSSKDVDVLQVKKRTKKNKLIVGVISLGCDKNRVDTEFMLTVLRDSGYKFTSVPANADILIVNTCGFIQKARDESVDAISEMSEYRKDPKCRCKRLIVTGCMTQKYSDELRQEFPEVDIFLGIDQYQDIAKIIENSFEKNKKIVKISDENTIPYVKKRMVTTPKHYAYLKIADGCNNFCTFCTIPSIRGRYRSKPMEDIIDEAKELVSGGATELIIVAQDITRYGIDKTNKSELVPLLQNLTKIEGLKWVRLLYCYPEMISDELIHEIVENPKICKYIDMPIQHISDRILKRMNRHTNSTQIKQIIKKLKSQPTFIAIRTTIMTGFPGEDENDFEEVCEFVRKAKLMHVGFFAYSREKGTVAGDFQDQISEETKKRRLLKLFKVQKNVVGLVNKQFVGRTLEVCYEGIDYDKRLYFGRCQYQTPEADSLVYFKTKKPLELGQYYNVKIKKVIGYDLLGVIENE